MKDIENEIDVFEKKPGFNNKEMWKQCELLRSVMFQTVETKTGRGKHVKIVKNFKHNASDEVRNRIANSCEYYKNLHEKDMEKRKIGSLEIVKYRFELIKGEPKIIIETVKVLDTDGNYMKFAKLEGVVNFLSKYPVTFKDI